MSVKSPTIWQNVQQIILYKWFLVKRVRRLPVGFSSMDSPHKSPIMRKAFPCDDCILCQSCVGSNIDLEVSGILRRFILIYGLHLTPSRLFSYWPGHYLILYLARDDGTIWVHFPHYWPFVRNWHFVRVLSQSASNAELWCLRRCSSLTINRLQSDIFSMELNVYHHICRVKKNQSLNAKVIDAIFDALFSILVIKKSTDFFRWRY